LPNLEQPQDRAEEANEHVRIQSSTTLDQWLVPSHRKTPMILTDGSIGRPIRTFQTTTRSCPDLNADLSSHMHQTQQHLALVDPTTQQELGALAPNTAPYSFQYKLIYGPTLAQAALISRRCHVLPSSIPHKSHRLASALWSHNLIFSQIREGPLITTSRLLWLMECYRGCPFEGGC